MLSAQSDFGGTLRRDNSSYNFSLIAASFSRAHTDCFHAEHLNVLVSSHPPLWADEKTTSVSIFSAKGEFKKIITKKLLSKFTTDHGLNYAAIILFSNCHVWEWKEAVTQNLLLLLCSWTALWNISPVQTSCELTAQRDTEVPLSLRAGLAGGGLFEATSWKLEDHRSPPESKVITTPRLSPQVNGWCPVGGLEMSWSL